MSSAVTTGPAAIDRLQRLALIGGLVGLALCAVGAALNLEQFYRSYLVAFLFCLGLPLGCLAILMLQHLTGGAWGLILRRLLESGTRTIPFVAILFIPLALGLHFLYEWAEPEKVAQDPILQWKSPYLNVPFFLSRAVLYFLVWMGLVILLNRWSREEDQTGDPDLPRRFRLISAPGLALYGLTITFAAIDWGMSLEPHWFSTIYGVIFAIGQVLTAYCLVVAGVIVLAGMPPLAGVLHKELLRDLGNLLLAFVMIWAYLSFSQFLLIWMANLREETPWYIARMEGGWQYLGMALIMGHFILPFLLLLSSDVKHNPQLLAGVAGFLLLMRFIDLYWTITPAFAPAHLRFHWLDLAAMLGVVGLWLAFFLWQLQRMPLLPAHDYRLQEVTAHE